MPVDTTTIAGLLKRIYSTEAVENIQNIEAVTYTKLTKSPKKPSGEGFFFPVNVQGNQRGQGSQNELEALRTPASQTPLQGKITPKVFTHTIRYSGLSMELAKGNEDSFADNVTFQVDEGIKDSTKELNAQCFRTGSGVIAWCNGAGPSTSLIYDTGVPTHFRVGEYIDVITAGGVKEVDSAKIATNNISTQTLTITPSSTWSDNSYIYRENTGDNAPTDGKELAGFPLITDTTTYLTTYENISRSTYPQWAGIVIAAGSVNVSNDMLQRAVSEMRIQGGRKPKKIISNTSQMRKYLDILVPLKRFQDASKMEWNGSRTRIAGSIRSICMTRITSRSSRSIR